MRLVHRPSGPLHLQSDISNVNSFLHGQKLSKAGDRATSDIPKSPLVHSSASSKDILLITTPISLEIVRTHGQPGVFGNQKDILTRLVRSE